MKTIRIICLSMALAGAALNARSEGTRTDINPALLYYQAFLVTPDLNQADTDYLFTNQWRELDLPERFGNLVAKYDNQFRLLRQAARCTPPCDWGIDMSAGPATLLPHLARSKAVSQATRLRVAWHLQHGRQLDAVDDWLSAFTLARNMPRDGTLISTLVEIANEAIDCNTLAENFGRFSSESLKRLEQGMKAAPVRRMVADCVATEKAYFLDWTLAKVRELQERNPGDETKILNGLRALLAADESPEEGLTNLWGEVMQAAGGASAGVVRLLQEREAIYPKLSEALAFPYSEYQAETGTFWTAMQQSPNPFLRITVAPWNTSRAREFRVLAYLAMVSAAVEYKLHGEAGLQSVTDPCGQGPFAFRRFVFAGVDRGFELRSEYDMNKNKAVLIFVENEGPAFRVGGNYPGEPLPTSPTPR